MDWTNETVVFYGVLTFLWMETLWDIYLKLRQITINKTALVVPPEIKHVMQTETFEKARIYGLDRLRFGVVQIIFSLFMSSAVIVYGLIYKFWHLSEVLIDNVGLSSGNEILVSMVFIFLVNTVSTIMDMPFTVYSTFLIEKRHGFNKQTVPFFIKDRIKHYILTQMLFVPIIGLMVYVVQAGGDYFFIWLWLVACVLTLTLATVYPSYIAPLFDKYEPLPDGYLRTSIENLAASVKFPLAQLYVVEGSKRSSHSNAYFTGMFGSKRIVLFDTLLHKVSKTGEESGCHDDEILAVLAHELGHWKLNHITSRIVIMQVNLFLVFAVFAFMFKHAPLYTAIGFPEGVLPIVGGLMAVLQLVLAPYNALLNFVLTVLSRIMEFQADGYASSLGFAIPLKSALYKLTKDNLGFPVHDWLYSSWNHSHPTLLQRISRLEKKNE